METLRGIRYKLRMMGVPIYGPLYIYGEDMLVIHNTQSPKSTFNNKSDSIFYHDVHKSVAIGDSLTLHVGTNNNCADFSLSYYLVQSAGFICKTYYTTFMMICENLRGDLGRHSVGGISGCVMGLNIGKA